jgi:hypothetical protein
LALLCNDRASSVIELPFGKKVVSQPRHSEDTCEPQVANLEFTNSCSKHQGVLLPKLYLFIAWLFIEERKINHVVGTATVENERRRRGIFISSFVAVMNK